MSVIWGPRLDAEAAEWQARAQTLARTHFAPLAAEIDRDQRYPHESIPVMVESGLCGMFLPREFGGSGASLTALTAAAEAVAAGCATTAAIISTYQLGAFPILLEGTPQQKAKYLGELARGHSISFALSEQGSGSDAAALATTAVREGDGWRLRGEKYWIGNGGISRYYVVFARTDPAAGPRGISAFVVDKERPGVAVDHYSDKMGIRGTRTSNLKLDTLVAAEDLVGTEGRALRLAFKTLDVGRVVVAAQSMGIALAAYEAARDRAASRIAFGQPIVDFQGISFQLADVATTVSAARMMMYEAAAAYDRGENISLPGAMAKLYATEVAHKAVDVAVQVWGGEGYCKPNLVERLYRDQRITEVYEGSSEIQRVVIGRAIKAEAEAETAAGGG
ncbi:alkylation response protein AidB-like acyl-CoA dehydrogenase [Stella humosa]|uniref:3-sulfinopropanoyl-CoA desulfinase n=1 Tax=Stella humosa TaxID=94 RepID=A0A3N1L801_9PROT|nr:acyl-CoA dehydrogenase family protein [Stella humosa]ROP90803.1 alkylation response protein AidB-like acyl-CoA dehydrogenase [Stella humosa]BBK34851.1 acyl-CoA dehydrogenase [Stella humosa]